MFLVWGLVYMRWEALTPFYASGLLILLAMIRRSTRIDRRRLVSIIDGAGKLLIETVGIILPLGLIVGGLIIGGVAHAFTASILALSGGVPLFALLLSAIACYVLGMLGLTTPAYIFLAVTLAPALIAVGFNVLAVHLFVIYYAMLAAITPPVAVGAFIAAGIAGASPMKTAWQAMRLGIVIYFIPFFFVYEPALVLQGTPVDFLSAFLTCVVGIVFIAAAVEGYLIKLGRLSLVIRVTFLAAGILLGIPGWQTDIIGALIAVLSVAVLLWGNRSQSKANYGGGLPQG